MRCPACFSLELASGKACSQCAASLTLEGTEGPMGVSCPRCEDELVGVRVGEDFVGECLRCTGLFVAHEVLERITRRTEERAGIRLRPAAPAANVPETRPYLECPRCSAHMGRKQFGARSGIVVDVCARHGVWFDRDELALAIAFVDAGGLVQAADRERAALRARERYGEAPETAEAGPGYDMVGSFLASLLWS